MKPGYVYRVWGVLCGIREIDLGPRQGILRWVIGQSALNHLGDGTRTPIACNDNGKIAA